MLASNVGSEEIATKNNRLFETTLLVQCLRTVVTSPCTVCRSLYDMGRRKLQAASTKQAVGVFLIELDQVHLRTYSRIDCRK